VLAVAGAVRPAALSNGVPAVAGKARTLLDELALPLVGSWWTVVAGLCVGLSAGIIAAEHLPPTSAPQPVKVCLLGVAIGLIVFVGPPLIRTAVNPVICSEAAIRDLTEVPVLATIPRIETPDTAGESRRRITLNVGLAMLSAVALAAVAVLTMA